MAWAKTEFPIPEETKIIVLPKIMYKGVECAGLAARGGRGDQMVVTLSRSVLLNRTAAIWCLFHELAHTILYDEGLGVLHGPRFHEVQGDLNDRWEHHGELDSLSFSLD